MLEEKEGFSARFDSVSASFRKISSGHEECKNKAADTISEVMRLYEQTQSRVLRLSAVDASEIREKIHKFNGKVETKDLGLKTMPGFVAETAVVWEETAELRNLAKKCRANVTVVRSLQ